MCKKIALCLMVLFNALTVWGQKEVLKFNRDGKFKIVQFTDVHYKYLWIVLTKYWMLNVLISSCLREMWLFPMKLSKGWTLFWSLASDAIFRLEWYLAIMMMSMIAPGWNCMIISRKRKTV